MIPLIPLVLSGLAAALWREHKQKKYRPIVQITPIEPATTAITMGDKKTQQQKSAKTMQVIDDAAEISHYQHVSLASLALSTSGAIFYAPIVLASIPLLSYNAFYFAKTIRRSRIRHKSSTMVIFEVASLAGTLLVGRYVITASLFTLSYSTRKWMLHAGNLANIGVRRAMDPQFNKIWILRNDVEIEISLSKMQPNDVAILHQGDVIRTNGIIIKGEGMIKQYSLTGIIQVIPKKMGDPVFSFTQVAAGDFQVKYIQ